MTPTFAPYPRKIRAVRPGCPVMPQIQTKPPKLGSPKTWAPNA